MLSCDFLKLFSFVVFIKFFYYWINKVLNWTSPFRNVKSSLEAFTAMSVCKSRLASVFFFFFPHMHKHMYTVFCKWLTNVGSRPFIFTRIIRLFE